MSEPSSPRLDAATIRQSMQVSTLEGIFGVQYITLTSAALLTGFLLSLGASAFQVGLVAMFPLVNGVLQPLGAELIRRRDGRRRAIAVTAVVVDALLWCVTLGLVATLPTGQAAAAVILVLAVQQFALAFHLVAWTSWISDLIPSSLRGRYFGRRNFICNALGAVTAVAAGQFVEQVGHNAVWSFGVLIVLAVGFRLVGARILARQPEPFPAQQSAARFRKRFTEPFTYPPFRRYLVFGLCWGFGIQLAAPFFAVYMIRDLHLAFGTVTLFAGFSTVSNLLGQRFWGPLCDRYGNQQVMRLTGFTVALQPLWWIFVAADGWQFYLIPLLHLTGGFAWSGFMLGNGNLMMNLAPASSKTSFFGMSAAVVGLFSALAPLTGGLLADAMAGGRLVLPAWLPAGLPVLFLLSTGVRLGAWGLLHRLEEPAHKPRLHATLLIRDTVRSLNVTQGFSPMLHPFTLDLEDDDLELDDALDALVRRDT